MMGSDIHHRTEDFRKLYKSVLSSLQEVMGTSNDVIVLVSSGTGALESAAVNFLSPGDHILICSAGKFGERFENIAKALGLVATVMKAPYGEAVKPSAVATALEANPHIKAVMVQASESSTGAAHDIETIAALVRKTPAILVVDAITGLGTMPLDIDGWGIDICVGGSQKAFMIPPGIAFLSISKKAWALNESAKLPRFYFDLKRELKNAVNGESAWTPNTSLIIALESALNYIRDLGGMPKLVENAQLLARATRAAAVALGLELFSNSPGSALTTIRAPRGMDSSLIVKQLRSRFGAIIANGQGEMKGQIFRIAHLGYFDFMDLFAIIAALEIVLNANGHAVAYGSGVAAAQRVYAEAAVPQLVNA